MDRASSYVIRVLQTAFAVAVLILAITVANHYNNETDFAAPSQINFLIFAPCFSLCSLIYLEIVPFIAPYIFYPGVALIFEVFNTSFYFGGFIAWAVFVSQLSFCLGPICTAAQLTAVAGGISFVLWAVTLVFLSRDVFGWGQRNKVSAMMAQQQQQKQAPMSQV